MGEDAGHAERLHLGHVIPAEFLPFVGEGGIDPGVVGAVADGVVVEERDGFMQVVQHLGVPVEIGVEDVAGEIEGHGHGVAVVVMGDVMAPVEKVRPFLVGVRLVPLVDVDHAVAAIDFDDGGDEDDHVGADVLDVRRVVDGQAIGELHQGGGRAGFRRVNGAGDVVDGPGLVDELAGGGVVEVDGAGVRQLGQAGVVGLGAGEQFRVGDGGGDHLAAFFRVADGEDLDAGTGGLEEAEVFVDIFGVGKHVRRAGYVAEDFGGRGDGFGGGQVVHQRRGEGRIGGVLVDLIGVLLIDGLGGVAGEVRVQLLGDERGGGDKGDEGNEAGQSGWAHGSRAGFPWESVSHSRAGV